MRQERREERHREHRTTKKKSSESQSDISNVSPDSGDDDESSTIQVSHFTENDAHLLVEDIKRKYGNLPWRPTVVWNQNISQD